MIILYIRFYSSTFEIDASTFLFKLESNLWRCHLLVFVIQNRLDAPKTKLFSDIQFLFWDTNILDSLWNWDILNCLKGYQYLINAIHTSFCPKVFTQMGAISCSRSVLWPTIHWVASIQKVIKWKWNNKRILDSYLWVRLEKRKHS